MVHSRRAYKEKAVPFGRQGGPLNPWLWFWGNSAKFFHFFSVGPSLFLFWKTSLLLWCFNNNLKKYQFCPNCILLLSQQTVFSVAFAKKSARARVAYLNSLLSWIFLPNYWLPSLYFSLLPWLKHKKKSIPTVYPDQVTSPVNNSAKNWDLEAKPRKPAQSSSCLCCLKLAGFWCPPDFHIEKYCLWFPPFQSWPLVIQIHSLFGKESPLCVFHNGLVLFVIKSSISEQQNPDPHKV